MFKPYPQLMSPRQFLDVELNVQQELHDHYILYLWSRQLAGTTVMYFMRVHRTYLCHFTRMQRLQVATLVNITCYQKYCQTSCVTQITIARNQKVLSIKITCHLSHMKGCNISKYNWLLLEMLLDEMSNSNHNYVKE